MILDILDSVPEVKQVRGAAVPEYVHVGLVGRDSCLETVPLYKDIQHLLGNPGSAVGCEQGSRLRAADLDPGADRALLGVGQSVLAAGIESPALEPVNEQAPALGAIILELQLRHFPRAEPSVVGHAEDCPVAGVGDYPEEPFGFFRGQIFRRHAGLPSRLVMRRYVDAPS